MRAPRVKICCIASVDEAELALAAGADALGLVSSMPSGPGVISDARVAQIATAVRQRPAVPAARTFLLSARTSAESLAAQQAAAQTTTLQLVEQVPLAELRRLRELCPALELVQVIHVLGEASLVEALQVAPWVDAILLDSGNPALAVKELGGTGRTHDWTWSRRIRDAIAPLPLWLAGGLRAHNVAAAVAAVRPYGLDLCTGVRQDGQLHGGLLKAFMAAVNDAAEPADEHPE